MDVSAKIPVIINIHVEPDERLIPFRKHRWYGYENLHAYLNSRRSELESATGSPVKFNWLFRLDYQIEHVYGSADWALHEYKALVEQSLEAGDSFGVHIHSWRPCKRLFRKTWVADFTDSDWIESCVNLAHNCYIDYFKRSPSYFSFGDHYMSESVLNQLSHLGYRCDATMYPGRPAIKRFVENELSIGVLPSFAEIPRHPFKVSLNAVADQTTKNTLWEIPISVASGKDSEQTFPDKLLLGIPFQKIPPIIQDNLSLPSPYLFAEVRTDVRMDRYNRSQFDQAVDYLIQHPLAAKMQYLSVDQFVGHLDAHQT